jgi:L-amino acid N-acyltransferase YncA
MTAYHEYYRLLSDLDPREALSPDGRLSVRPAVPADSGALAALMIAAYRGTIDYDGETVEEALQEVEAYLAGERGGPPLLDVSRLAFAGPQLVGACLAGEWEERQLPLISYVMTRAEWKKQAVAGRLLWAVLQALRERGYREARAVITEGNIPSERLFGRLGFQKISS